MTPDDALALYNAGPKVVIKILCDLSNTVESQKEQITLLEAKVASLEGELGRRTLEASFFRSALRRVEGLRRQSDEPGGTASTTRSATGSRKAD